MGVGGDGAGGEDGVHRAEGERGPGGEGRSAETPPAEKAKFSKAFTT